MEETAEKTSTWLALRNPVFRRLWLVMVISGSCIGAHNTAVYWAMHKLGASTLHIALMTTVSALPYTLFTLPAGAIADMVDRKKILLTVQIWHASIAFALAILWMAHLLNPYLILVSAFLFSALASVGRSKFHFWRQRARFPSDVSGASAVEAGKGPVKPSTGELL
jgi:MFS family permease